MAKKALIEAESLSAAAATADVTDIDSQPTTPSSDQSDDIAPDSKDIFI